MQDDNQPRMRVDARSEARAPQSGSAPTAITIKRGRSRDGRVSEDCSEAELPGGFFAAAVHVHHREDDRSGSSKGSSRCAAAPRRFARVRASSCSRLAAFLTPSLVDGPSPGRC